MQLQAVMIVLHTLLVMHLMACRAIKQRIGTCVIATSSGPKAYHYTARSMRKTFSSSLVFMLSVSSTNAQANVVLDMCTHTMGHSPVTLEKYYSHWDTYEQVQLMMDGWREFIAGNPMPDHEAGSHAQEAEWEDAALEMSCSDSDAE